MQNSARKVVMSRYYVGLESRLAMQKIAEDDRMGWRRHRASRRSTPSAIIHVIVDNLFRRNRGECTAHVGSVAGNLVNIHVRIKPLASVSADRSKGNGEERHGRGEDARRKGKTSCRTCGLVQLFSLCYVTSVVTGFSPRLIRKTELLFLPFFFVFVIQE